MSYNLIDVVEIASNFAVVGAFVFTWIAFWKTFSRQRKSDQVNIADRISGNLTLAEDKLIRVYRESETQYEKRKAILQYLNEWEWFSFLVNSGEITDEKIHDHFRPTLITDYSVLLEKAEVQHIKNDPSAFKQFKALYEKWKDIYQRYQ